jgi:hypothetical protein
VAPSPTLCSLTVSAEQGLDCWIIRWMRSRTRWIIGREPLVFCPDHLPGSRSCGGRDVLRDRPQKRRHLAGNCGNDQRTLFAGGGEPTVTGAQANLCLPGNLANRFWQPLEPGLQGLADAGRKTIGRPGAQAGSGTVKKSVPRDRAIRSLARGISTRRSLHERQTNCGGGSPLTSGQNQATGA